MSPEGSPGGGERGQPGLEAGGQEGRLQAAGEGGEGHAHCPAQPAQPSHPGQQLRQRQVLQIPRLDHGHGHYRGGSQQQQPHRQPEGPHPGHDGLLQGAGRGGEHGEGGGRGPGARHVRGVVEAHVGLD